MLRVLLALLITSITGCATTPDYAGSDGGKVVIGIGAGPNTQFSHYALLFREAGEKKRSDDQTAAGRFTYYHGDLFRRQAPDYKKEDETGVVLALSLPPGNYEIFNFDIFLNTPFFQTNYSSRTPFSIPFVVRTGQTTYLGNYQANRTTAPNLLGVRVGSGAVFAVSNRLVADLAIARKKDPAINDTAEDATPSVSSVRNPFFVLPK